MNDQTPLDTLDWFSNLLDTHGSQPDKWPQDAVQRATSLVEQEPAARALLAQAEQLDARLDDFVVPPPGGQIAQAIHQAIPFTDRNLIDTLLNWIFPPRRELLWKPVLVTAMPLLVGFVIGVITPISDTDESITLQEETIYLAGLETNYEGDLEP